MVINVVQLGNVCVTVTISWHFQNTDTWCVSSPVSWTFSSYSKINTRWWNCVFQPFYCLWLLSGKTNSRLLPSAFSSWTAGQSTSLTCWAPRPLSSPQVSEVGSHLDSSSIHSSCPLTFDSADWPEEGSTKKNAWVRRFLRSNTLLRLLYFLCFVRFCRHQCKASSVHDVQHAKSSSHWEWQGVKGLPGIISAKNSSTN